ncbi:MAG: diguanylate cyclase domain-containing protein [Acholeplasmataceae bacterium]
MLYVIQVNTYSFILCSIIYISMLKNTPDEQENHPFLRLIVLFTMVNLLLDIPNVLLEGQPGTIVSWWILIGNSIAYFLVVASAFFWFLYVDYFIFQDTGLKKRLPSYLLLPIVMDFVLIVLNPPFGLLFSVDASNDYVRGPLFLVHVVMSYTYFFLAYFHTLRNRKLLNKGNFYALLAFPFFPVIGGIMQVLYYETLLIWPSVTLGLLFIHLFVQRRLILIDSLTGLYNKREFNKKVFEITKQKPKNNRYGGIIIDIDNFKSVNDNFGHSTGDDALQAFGRILERSFGDDAFVARIGGDEFAAIIKTETTTSLDGVIELIERNIDRLNRTGKFPFPFSFSYGVRMYDPKEGKDFKAFIDDLDHYMYQRKKR